MPPPPYRTEAYVGLFVLLGLGLLGWLVFHFGDFRGIRSDGYPLLVEVRDATGIRKGVPVRLGGVEIGRASGEPELNESYTLLTIPLTIYSNSKIPANSTVKVGTSGLMGDSFVRIIPPEVPSGKFLEPGHRLLAESSSSLDDLAGSAGETLKEVNLTAGEIRAAADQMESLFSKLDRGFLTSENMENVSLMLADLRSASQHINEASQKLNPLLDEAGVTLKEVSAVADAARTTLAGVDHSVLEFSKTLVAANPVIGNFDETLQKLTATLKTTDELLNLLQNGEGMAPALLKDSTLKRDLESFLNKLDRNGLLLYPREGGLLRDLAPLEGPSSRSSSAEGEKRIFPGLKKQP